MVIKETKKKMKKTIIIISVIILAILLLSGCENKITGRVIVCELPYIRHASGCCLDRNDNSICDKNEMVEVSEEVGEGEEIQEPKGEVYLPMPVMSVKDFLKQINSLQYFATSSQALSDSFLNIINIVETIQKHKNVNMDDKQALLVDELPNPLDKNAIIISNPCFDSVIEEIMGITCEEWNSLNLQKFMGVLNSGNSYALIIATDSINDEKEFTSQVIMEIQKQSTNGNMDDSKMTDDNAIQKCINEYYDYDLLRHDCFNEVIEKYGYSDEIVDYEKRNCQNEYGDSDILYSSCIQGIAEKYADESICSELSSWLDQNECYTEVAIKKGKYEICMNIDWNLDLSYCFYGVEILSSNSNCDDLSGNEKIMCLAVIENNYFKCDEIEDSSDKSKCQSLKFSIGIDDRKCWVGIGCI